jgi:outer membrane protein assembly factor BamB
VKPFRTVILVAALLVSLASSSQAVGSGDASRAETTSVAARSAWPMFGFNVAHTGNNTDETILGTSNVGELVLKWSRSTGDRGACCGSPVVSKGGTVVVPGGDFLAHAFDAATGARRWVSPNGVVSSAGAIFRGIVYFGDSQGVTAFRVSTGHVLWENQTCNGQQINAPPIVANGTVYAGLNDPELIALEADTGACTWEALAKMGYDGGSSPALSNGHLYVGDDNGHDVSVSVANGVVYAASDKLYAFDAKTGTILWSGATGKRGIVRSAPAIANGMVYVEGFNNRLYAFGLP